MRLSNYVNNWLFGKFQAKICSSKVRSKMHSGAAMLVTAVRAIREAYGDEGVEIVHQAFLKRAVDLGELRSQKKQDKSLRAFCSAIEKSCAVTHKWQKVEDTDNRQAYRFSYCMWADVFRQLGAADIGYWICEGDEPAVTAFNDKIGFRRTITLMEGYDCCDHVYFGMEESKTKKDS